MWKWVLGGMASNWLQAKRLTYICKCIKCPLPFSYIWFEFMLSLIDWNSSDTHLLVSGENPVSWKHFLLFMLRYADDQRHSCIIWTLLQSENLDSNRRKPRNSVCSTQISEWRRYTHRTNLLEWYYEVVGTDAENGHQLFESIIYWT